MRPRGLLFVLLLSFVVMATAAGAFAGEHPGEHPGEEWADREHVEKTIKGYIDRDMGLKGGYFLLWDEKEGRTLRLTFSKFHPKVRYIEKEGAYFMCTDFLSVEDRRVIDVDFWVKPTEDGTLRVTAIKIHKVNGFPRFIYEKDRIKPLQ